MRGSHISLFYRMFLPKNEMNWTIFYAWEILIFTATVIYILIFILVCSCISRWLYAKACSPRTMGQSLSWIFVSPLKFCFKYKRSITFKTKRKCCFQLQKILGTYFLKRNYLSDTLLNVYSFILSIKTYKFWMHWLQKCIWIIRH